MTAEYCGLSCAVPIEEMITSGICEPPVTSRPVPSRPGRGNMLWKTVTT